MRTGQHRTKSSAPTAGAPGEPRPPEASELSAHNWKTAIGSARRHMKKDRVNVAAGAFAYRWFLSLFPLIIALLGAAALISMPSATSSKLAHGISKALPPGAAGVVTAAVSHAAKRTAGALSATVVAAAIALWSGTSGMVMVEEGLDMAYEVGQDRSFLAKRLVALPLLAITVVLGGFASALIVFGAQIRSAISGLVPFGGAVFRDGWTVVHWLVALALIAVLLSCIYYLAPNRQHPRWRWVSPGAAFATVLWAVISIGFSYYTSSFGSYGKTYGAFAGVAILIFWLYLTGLAVLIGGEVNAAFEREAALATRSAQAGNGNAAGGGFRLAS